MLMVTFYFSAPGFPRKSGKYIFKYSLIRATKNSCFLTITALDAFGQYFY